MPLFSTLSFHLLSLLIRSSSVSAITAKSSAYNNSYGKATLDCLDETSIKITDSNGLSAEPWCRWTFTSKHLLLTQTVPTAVFLHLCTQTWLPILTILQLQLMHCPSYYLLWNSIKSVFQIHKAKIELLSFTSKLLLHLLHLSYNKKDITGPPTFPNCTSKLHIVYRVRLKNIPSIKM